MAAQLRRPGRQPPPEPAAMVSTWVPDPAPPPPGGPTLPGPWGCGRTAEAGGHELCRGPRAWERVTSGLYHGGGGGGGPGPGVCGSPPGSRARRFHFPGYPGVNIRVSAPLPPRRAAATFLPRPGRARARPHAAGSRPMSAQGRGDRQVWSAAPGGGAPKGEVRGGACERAEWGAAAGGVGGSVPGAGTRSGDREGVSVRTHTPGRTLWLQRRGWLSDRARGPPGRGRGRRWGWEGSGPARPARGTRGLPRGPGTAVASGPAGLGEIVRAIPRCDRSAATRYVRTWIKSLHLSRISKKRSHRPHHSRGSHYIYTRPYWGH